MSSASKTMQPWLFQQLVDQAVIDETGINDRPKARHCPTCRATTLAAWRDGNLDPVHVDPIALTPLGELQALVAGVETFQHWGGATGGLDTRRAKTIARHPAGTDRLSPVRPLHRCGAPTFDHYAEPVRVTVDDAPPF